MAERIPISTALRVPLKAYLSSDGKTPATGKTIVITISKNGAAYANPSVGATNATEIGSGSYYVDLSTTDTATNGPLFVKGTNVDIDQVDTLYFVGVVNANVTSINSVSTVAVVQVNQYIGTSINPPAFDIAVAAATASTLVLASTDAYGNAVPDVDQYTNYVFQVVGGTGVGQIVQTTSATTGARTYNVLAGTMQTQLDNTSQLLSLGSYAVNVTAANGIALGAAGSLHILGANVGDTTYTGSTGPGITYTGASGFPGSKHQGTGTGNGIDAIAGASGTNFGFRATTLSAAGFGGEFLGTGGRAGLFLQGGATGVGLDVAGGGTSGAAMRLTNTSGDVLTVTGSSTIGAMTVASLTVSGAVAISGALTAGATTMASLTISGALSAGASTLTSLTVTGNTTFNSNFFILGSLTVDAATTLTGAFTATNASNDVRGVRLGSSGLDAISATSPTTVASTFREKVLQVWERFFGKVVEDVNTTTIKVMQGTGSTPQTTQTYSQAAGITTVNRSS